MPAGSSVTITAELVPLKFINTSYQSCGTDTQSVALRFSEADIASNSRILSDPNYANSHVYNTMNIATNYYTRVFDVKTTDIPDIAIGKITQKTCPATDLAVTNFSQSFVGKLEVESVKPTNGNAAFYEYDRVVNPKPITFTATYANLGNDDADKAYLEFTL